MSSAVNYLPKIVTVLREGYGWHDARADAIAGLTVAIVALPLSMAIAIASGVTPDRGLYTSVVGGFVVSALGGSRYQIGGPAGAFIVLVAATVARHGFDGLVLATFLAGLILMAIGFLRLGTFVKYIPFPVTVGFTAGIAIIIAASQLRDLFGLRLASPEPGPLIPKIEALSQALPTINAAALGIALAGISIVVMMRRLRPRWPAFLIAVALTTVAATILHLPVETIGSRFGGMPSSLPMPRLPDLSVDKIVAILPSALSFALLGSIESLLSAVVADGMSGGRHRPNCELVAQGVANIASSLFGGICVTGTIARTATNVRAGARGPISGMLHSAFLLVFILVAAPLARFIPLSALSAILAVVCGNMAEKQAVVTLLRAYRGEAIVLAVTFLTVIFVDLTSGILAGFGVGALLFLHRAAQELEIRSGYSGDTETISDSGEAGQLYDPAIVGDPDIAIYRVSGAFFFGSAAIAAAILDRLGQRPKAYILDLSSVGILDSTAIVTIESFVRKARKRCSSVILTGVRSDIRRTMDQHGLKPPHLLFADTIAAALPVARRSAIETAFTTSTADRV